MVKPFAGAMMENGSFHDLSKNLGEHLDQKFELANASFNDQTSDDFSIASGRNSIPETRKSNTVEALISQNEDITARLKIALRRMQMLEDENTNLMQELNETKIAHSSTSDQMLVWKEKEKIWKERFEKAETDLQAFRDRFPESLRMEAKLEKLMRYQERVKTTIKPYVQQLKDYAQSLHLQIQSQNHEIETREAQVNDRNQEIVFLKEKLEDQARFYEMNQNDLIAGYEKQKDFYQHEIQSLSENLAVAEEKNQRLNSSLERQDELENLVISLRRNKDDFQANIQAEIEELRQFNSEARKDLIENNLRIQDLQKELQANKNQLAEAFSKKQDLEEQLTSLRYMWSEQSQEKEKMELSISSLEKINLELSTKLSELRRQV